MLSLDITISGQGLLWAIAGLSLTTLLLGAFLRRYLHGQAGRIIPLPAAQETVAERKKYRLVDVFRLRGTFLQFGLVLSLGFAVLGFAWTEYEPKADFQLSIEDDIFDIMEIPPPTATPPPPPPPPPPPQIVEVPEEEILDEEEPEFVDVSISEEDAIIVPEPIVVPPPPPTPKEKTIDVPDIFRVVEQMPLFPGCESGSKAERQKCSDKKLLSFMAKHIKYPVIARENGIEGNSYISFIVEKNGTITDAKIMRAPGGGLGEEALRVVNLMNEKNIIWNPGKQRNEPVRVQFSLPVKFSLQ